MLKRLNYVNPEIYVGWYFQFVMRVDKKIPKWIEGMGRIFLNVIV